MSLFLDRAVEWGLHTDSLVIIIVITISIRFIFNILPLRIQYHKNISIVLKGVLAYFITFPVILCRIIQKVYNERYNIINLLIGSVLKLFYLILHNLFRVRLSSE